MLINYLFFSSILVLVLVYFLIIGKKTLPINILYLPTILGCIVLIYYVFSGIEEPYDIRKVEYTAIGMKHYKFKKNKSDFDFYTGLYKDLNGEYKEFEIPKGTYNYFSELWKKDKKEFEISPDSINHLYFIGWNKKPEDALIYTSTQSFLNYFKHSLWLYDFNKVTEDVARKEKLFKRGRIDIINSSCILEPRQSLVYGIPVSDSESRRISNISTIDPEFRPVLLVWVGSEDEKHKIINHQKSYVGGGKSNEVIFCVNINNLVERKIIWAGSFSWAITNELENYVISEAFKEGTELNIDKYCKSLVSGYSKNLWQPRDFKKYSILSMPVSEFTTIMSSILVIIANILLAIRAKKIRARD